MSVIRNQIDKRIYEVLSENGPMMSREIAEEIGEDPRTVRASIRRLHGKGKVWPAVVRSHDGNTWKAV